MCDRKRVLKHFIEARTHLDRVIGDVVVESASSLVPAGDPPRSDRYDTSEAIAGAIAALDLAFDAWLDAGEARCACPAGGESVTTHRHVIASEALP